MTTTPTHSPRTRRAIGRPSIAPGARRSATVYAKVTPYTHECLLALCEREKRGVSEMLRIWIEEKLGE